MEAKSSVKNLDPLPKDGDDFWKLAFTEKKEIPKGIKCQHEFVRKTGRETECVKCRCGFILGIEEVKNGHIYIHGSLII